MTGRSKWPEMALSKLQERDLRGRGSEPKGGKKSAELPTLTDGRR